MSGMQTANKRARRAPRRKDSKDSFSLSQVCPTYGSEWFGTIGRRLVYFKGPFDEEKVIKWCNENDSSRRMKMEELKDVIASGATLAVLSNPAIGNNYALTAIPESIVVVLLNQKLKEMSSETEALPEYLADYRWNYQVVHGYMPHLLATILSGVWRRNSRVEGVCPSAELLKLYRKDALDSCIIEANRWHLELLEGWIKDLTNNPNQIEDLLRDALGWSRGIPKIIPLVSELEYSGANQLYWHHPRSPSEQAIDPVVELCHQKLLAIMSAEQSS